MLKQLQQVSGCVGVKDYIAALTHVAIAHGRVHAFDGRTYACAMLDKQYRTMQFCAPAKQFTHAMEVAGEGVTINVEQQTQKLYIDGKNKFSSTLPLLPIESFPVKLQDYTAVMAKMTGATKIKKAGELLPKIARLRPIIADDASRPWANALRIDDGVGSVTNNVIVVTAPMEFPFPVSLPTFLLDELLRLQLNPTHAARTATSDEQNPDPGGVALWLDDNVQLRSVTVHGDWPKSPAQLLDELHKKAKLIPMPSEAVLQAIDFVLPFARDAAAPVIEMEGDEVRVRGAETMGARMKVAGLKVKNKVAFRAEPLKLALALMTHWDPLQFPRVPFTGANDVRGGMAGVAL
jgi:hypothetical protein